MGRKFSLAMRGESAVKMVLANKAMPTTCRPPNLSANIPPINDVVRYPQKNPPNIKL